jgi:hypothetical protein
MLRRCGGILRFNAAHVRGALSFAAHRLDADCANKKAEGERHLQILSEQLACCSCSERATRQGESLPPDPGILGVVLTIIAAGNGRISRSQGHK